MPECCEYPMLEIESAFENENGETEIIGHECQICKSRIDLNGKEIHDGK